MTVNPADGVRVHAPPRTSAHVRVLGQVRVTGRTSSEARPLTSLPANLVLALLLAPGRSLSTGSLIEEVWGEQPPDGAKAALQTLVSRTRSRHRAGIIVSTAGGYALQVGDGGTDIELARTLVSQGRAALATGDVVAAEARAVEGLALWSGEPGAGATSETLVEELAGRAALVRADLHQVQAEAMLAAGRYPEAVRLVEMLRASAPFSDPLCLLHLRALAAAGRSNDAVDEFARFRLGLAETLGTDPSQELGTLHESLLRQETSAVPAVRIVVGVRPPTSPLVGREREVDEVLGRLATQRLVTVLGMGGVGKTRLAQEVASRATASYPAVYVVELAAARTGLEVALSIASTLGAGGVDGPGAPEESLPRVIGQVVTVLADRPALLVLDNLEQVADPAADVVASLLSAAPSTRVLATSRAVLGVAGEHVLGLAPLSTVADDDVEPAAVRLFRDRAHAVRPGAHLPSDVVVRLCERLDGLPLAIELAAARVRSMPVAEIEGRLGDRFSLLTSGDRSVPARHRTLHDVIAWSWDLLDAGQQRACRRVAFFPDGFTSEAAASVVEPEPEPGLEGDRAASVALLDALDALVAQSFVRLDEDPETGTSRLRMLETVREFCQQQAVAAGEVETVRAAAFAWARRTCTVDLAQLHGPAQELTFRRLATERENLVAILREAVCADEPDTVACVFATTALWQMHRGSYLDVTTVAPSVQDALSGRAPEGRWAVAHLWSQLLVGVSQLVLGDVRRGARARLDVLRASRAARGTSPLAEAAVPLLRSISDLAEVDRLLAEACTSRDRTTALLAQLLLAVRAEDHGDLGAALECAASAHRAAVEAHDLWARAAAATLLARLYRQAGRPKDALWWGADAAAGFGALGIESHDRSVSRALDQLADGRLDEAEQAFRVALDVPDQSSGHALVAAAGLAEVHLARGLTDDGLDALRALVGRLVWSATDRIAPHLLVGSTCVVAHVLDGGTGTGTAERGGAQADDRSEPALDGGSCVPDGRPSERDRPQGERALGERAAGGRRAEVRDHPWLDEVVASMRVLLLQVDEIAPEYMDRPILGAVLVARAAWATASGTPGAGAGAGAGARTGTRTGAPPSVAEVVELLALAERLHSRQDLPHLVAEPVWQAVRRWSSLASDPLDWDLARSAAHQAADDLSLADAARRALLLVERLG